MKRVPIVRRVQRFGDDPTIGYIELSEGLLGCLAEQSRQGLQTTLECQFTHNGLVAVALNPQPVKAHLPSPNLEKVINNDPYVGTILKSGGSLEDCVVALAEQKTGLMQRLVHLELLAPRKLRLPNGFVYIYHAPDDVIPETALHPRDWMDLDPAK